MGSLIPVRSRQAQATVRGFAASNGADSQGLFFDPAALLRRARRVPFDQAAVEARRFRSSWLGRMSPM